MRELLGPSLLSIYLLVSWLLVKILMITNSTEYLRGIFIINGTRFQSLTKITLVIYSNTQFLALTSRDFVCLITVC